MTFLSKFFRRKSIDDNAELIVDDIEESVQLNAKEKQLLVISEILKPLLKNAGYRTSGNKWWKINGIYFNLIELQNFSWNSRNSVDFCFNFTTGFVNDIENLKKPRNHDGLTFVREGYFKVPKDKYWNGNNGYHIEDTTALSKFKKRVLDDFKDIILPKLALLTTEEAIYNFYSNSFWGPFVKQSLKLGRKDIHVSPDL